MLERTQTRNRAWQLGPFRRGLVLRPNGDDYTWERLALAVDTSLAGVRVARELDRIARERRRPCLVIS